jgi:hypothetical protein
MQFQEHIAPPNKITRTNGCQNRIALMNRSDPKPQGINLSDPAPGDAPVDQSGQRVCADPLPLPTGSNKIHRLAKIP